MSQNNVATNYNAAGTVIMEMIYADNFLSPGGLLASTTLAQLGQISPGQRILDVGSGLGGAAFYLAEQQACSVLGIELMEPSAASAARRAKSKGLAEQVHFVCGDASRLPLAAQQFDVGWGQDAWCHLEDKGELLATLSKLLVPGGRLVFSDWLLGQSASASNAQIRKVTASPAMACEQDYRDLLQANGFELTAFRDNGDWFVAGYRQVVQRLRTLEHQICRQFSNKVFEIVLAKQARVLDAFTSGELVSGSFVAYHSGA